MIFHAQNQNFPKKVLENYQFKNLICCVENEEVDLGAKFLEVWREKRNFPTKKKYKI